MKYAMNRTSKTSRVFSSILSPRLLAVLLFVTLFVSGCAKSSDGGTDGESHFLLSCDTNCEGGLSCICGICTTICEDNKSCEALSSKATCVDPRISKTCQSSDNDLSGICDVACDSRDGCLHLGSDFECQAGFCRIGGGEPSVDAGGIKDDEDAASVWEVIESNTSEPLIGIWGSASDDIWALSQHELLHYDGQSWEVAIENEQWHLKSLWGSASDDIWAVGVISAEVSTTLSSALIAHYDGVSWLQYDLGETALLSSFTGVWGTSADNVYAFRATGGLWLLPWHWDGSSWKEHDAEIIYGDGSDGLSAEIFGARAVAHGTSSDNIVVADFGGLIHYDGNQWTVLESQLLPFCWADAAWALSNGDFLVAESVCGIYRYRDGSATIDLETSRPSPDMVSFGGFWGFSDTDIFAVGYEYRQGNMWNETTVVASRIWHYDGQSWSEEDLDDLAVELSAIWGSPSGAVWVVGGEGTILRLRPRS